MVTGRVVFALAALAVPLAPRAATIPVAPGVGTLQDAIDSATAGDTLVLAEGIYDGAVVIDRRLTIRAPNGDGVINGGCAPVALDIAADGVSIKGSPTRGHMAVVGGTEAAIRIAGRSNVKLSGVRALEVGQCPTPVGLEVTGVSRLRITRSSFEGSLHGGRVHDLTADAGVTIKHSLFETTAAVSGEESSLLLMGVAPGAPRGGARVRITSCGFGPFNGANKRGLYLVDTDGVTVVANTMFPAGASQLGVDIDADSDQNLLRRNRFLGPAADAGTGNCWIGNLSVGGFTLPSTCP